MQILAQLELRVNLILEFKMLIRNVILVGLGALSITTNCYANFSVQTNKWPKQEGKYGHSYNTNHSGCMSLISSHLSSWGG